jgi:SAM-dependent methyltransferase
MEREWDERARTDAQGFIGRGYADSDASFWASGEPDLTGLILDGLELDPRAAVLEIGCGVGRLLRPLAKRAGRVIGMDIAATMVTEGRRLLADLPHVEFHVTRGRFETITAASLDLVYSFAVFQHIPSKRVIAAYIAEAARTLKGGGVLKIQVDGRRRPFWRGTDTWLGIWFTPREIRRVLEAHGFELVDTWGEATQYYWLTAIRRTEPGRPVTALIQAHRPAWNTAALTTFLTRLHQPATTLPALLDGRRSLRDCAMDWLSTQPETTATDFVRAAFQAVLGREPDAAGLAFYTAQLARGGSRAYLLDCLLSSAELRVTLRTPATAR